MTTIHLRGFDIQRPVDEFEDRRWDERLNEEEEYGYRLNGVLGIEYRTHKTL